jgi:hypothetical protein
MNALNRLLAILATLAAIVVVTLAAAMPAEMLGVLVTGLTGLKGLAERLLPAGRLLVGAAGLAVIFILLLWLWLEIRRPRHRTVQVSQANGTRAEVTTETLTERLETAVDALAGVVYARARVRSYGRAVEVSVEAEITPLTPVAVTAGRIGETVREVTEGAMGLRLRGKPKVRIKAVRMPEEPPALPFVEPPEPEPETVAVEKPELALANPEEATEKPSPRPS